MSELAGNEAHQLRSGGEDAVGGDAYHIKQTVRISNIRAECFPHEEIYPYISDFDQKLKFDHMGI